MLQLAAHVLLHGQPGVEVPKQYSRHHPDTSTFLTNPPTHPPKKAAYLNMYGGS
jgi:hypothetical protein